MTAPLFEFTGGVWVLLSVLLLLLFSVLLVVVGVVVGVVVVLFGSVVAGLVCCAITIHTLPIHRKDNKVFFIRYDFYFDYKF